MTRMTEMKQIIWETRRDIAMVIYNSSFINLPTGLEKDVRTQGMSPIGRYLILLVNSRFVKTKQLVWVHRYKFMSWYREN